MRRVIIAAASAGALAGQAVAQDETEAGIELQVGATTVTISGQVNQALLVHDDGVRTETFGPVDNDVSSSRIAAEFEAEVSDGLTFGGTLELEVQPYPSHLVSQEDRGRPDFGFADDDLRKLELSLGSDRLGTLFLGQGDMASNKSAEVDLSGTTVVVTSDVEDNAGGQLLRGSDGTLSDLAIGDDFDNLDGLSRRVRLRYDAPELLDDRLTLSASYGRDLIADDRTDSYDVAATFVADTDALSVEAAVAQAWEGSDATILSGSASVLHASGLSATVAAGRQDDDGATSGFGYAKVGYEVDLIAAGVTAMSMDLYRSADLAAEGSSGRAYGVALVQTIEQLSTDVYLAVRVHDYDDATGDYRQGASLMVGARIQF